MVILCADLLLWLNAVTEDTIHQEMELEKEKDFYFGGANMSFSTESTENYDRAGADLGMQSTNMHTHTHTHTNTHMQTHERKHPFPATPSFCL